ncbi:MAG TPA: hypothetical protein DGT23_31945 [Micromonosporaceae bacterium]|nr:hypothetical protein [Micromonosporaceae bacterium]
MSRAEMVKNILVLEEFAAEAKKLAAAQRLRLDEQARAELAEQGTAATWRLADIATVVLPLSKEKIVVSDADALLKWVKHQRPDEVEIVTTTRVRPSYLTVLTGTMKVADDVVVDPDTGEIVPGLAAQKGGIPGTLRITAEPGVKAVVGAAVAQMLGTAHAAITGPVVEGEALPEREAAFAATGDPFALFPPVAGAS